MEFTNVGIANGLGKIIIKRLRPFMQPKNKEPSQNLKAVPYSIGPE